MFCPECGNSISENDTFCGVCGRKLRGVRVSESSRIGFSNRVNDPAIHAALKRNKKATTIFAMFLVPAPLVIALILSALKDKPEYITVGVAVSGVFLITSLISGAKKKAEKQWDGTVVDKRTEQKRTSRGDEPVWETEYVLKIQTDSGEIKYIRESGASRSYYGYYDYFNLGDRLRYHPQFNCFYEKYDKTWDKQLLCPVCGRRNNIELDTCANCGVPIIK